MGTVPLYLPISAKLEHMLIMLLAFLDRMVTARACVFLFGPWAGIANPVNGIAAIW